MAKPYLVLQFDFDSMTISRKTNDEITELKKKAGVKRMHPHKVFGNRNSID